MIKIQNLVFAYNDQKKIAVNNISCNIEYGQYIAIIGHNGSGKSTLSKLIVGLLKPQSGKIIINDIEIKRKTLNQIRKLIGIVFQNPENQFVGSTVEDDIAFGLENKQMSRSEMKNVVINQE